MPLLSKIPGDPTIGSFRVEKENCSTHRGLQVGTGFGSFDKLREVGGFILLVLFLV